MAINTFGDTGKLTPAGMRSAGISYQELLRADSRCPDSNLLKESPIAPGETRIRVDRYFKKELHDLEVEKIWKRVWQMACREDDLPDIGDYLVYDIASLSFLVVRTGENEFKAYPNACLHRGRQLREWDGKKADEIRCPFHGWSWHIDGRLKQVVNAWDLPCVTPEEYSLPEVKVGRWGGWVFINPDPDCGSFEDYIGELPDHFAAWEPEKRWKQVHVAKVLRCNWKVGQEAFMEAYHNVATHPQIAYTLGDSNSQYDVFGNFARALSPSGTPSPHLKYTISQEETFNTMLGANGPGSLPAGKTARAALGDNSRQNLRLVMGERADSVSDAEGLDAMYYTLFPNFHPWGGYRSTLNYRFRPYGNDPDMCIHETMFLTPWPEGEPKPKPAQIHWLDADQDYTEAPELGPVARVMQQDVVNMPKVQIGMKSLRSGFTTLTLYSETKVRHFHQLWDEWVRAE